MIPKLLTYSGNALIVLAVLFYLVPLQLILREAGRRRDDGGAIWAAFFVLGPLLLFFCALLSVTVARGAWDWLPMGRVFLYPLVLATGAAVIAVMLFSFLGRVESPNQLPWAARPFRGWAVQVFPPIVLTFALLALNPGLGDAVPALLYRAPMAAVAVVSLLASAAMLVQLGLHTQQRQLDRIQQAESDHAERDRRCLSEVQAMDPKTDFASLIHFANRYEKEEIRALAIAKAKSHPDFLGSLQEVLTHSRAEEAFIYLDACPLPADEMAKLQPLIPQGMQILTQQVAHSVERTHTFHPEQFDWTTRLLLSVADRFSGSGPNLVPVVRQFRQTLDSDRTQNVPLNARHTLDTWLAHHPATSHAP